MIFQFSGSLDNRKHLALQLSLSFVSSLQIQFESLYI